jgi:xanthine dehydrogenase YagR molybdenum-binding subunit
MSRKVEVTTGIPGAPQPMAREARELPDDAPAPWGESAALREVGKRTPRLDGIDKVTGRARYTADVQRPGMLHGRILRSPHPHARIRRIDTAAAEAAEGVKAVVVVRHLLGVAQEAGEDKGKGPDAPLPTVRYAGQPIAAVAAATPEQAAAALSRIQVDYEVLPHVVDPIAAMDPKAPPVFAGKVSMSGSAGGGGAGGDMQQRGNVRGPRRGGKRQGQGQGQGETGDPAAAQRAADAALAGAAAKVEATFRTQVQTHSALETHGLVAEWSGDELTVWASTQGLYSVRDELAEVLGVPRASIRVLTDFCGGGFGAKFGAGNYGVLAAQLARKARAPVRLCLDRHEEHVAVGNRPASQQTVALGADRDGKLQAIKVTGWGAGGAGAGAGFAGPAQNLYACPLIYTEESDVFTHTGPLAAFRAPGHPQGAFALESAMDELAERLGIDPLVLRERNDPHPARREERRRGAEAVGWARRHPAGRGPAQGDIRRGLGMAQGLWYHLINLNAHAEVRIHRDGTVELLTGVQDIGGGIRTPLSQVVAEELGLPARAVRVVLGDTRLPPGPASGGSVTTASITPAARDAAHAAGKALLAQVAASLGVSTDRLTLTQGEVHIAGGRGPQRMTLKQAAARMRKDSVSGTGERQPDYGGFQRGPFNRGEDRRGIGHGQLGGVQFVEVEVDIRTGVIRVERVVAAHDCGRPMNPMLAESQIKGGILQGISYALFEERRLDLRTGRMLNPNLEQYKIAGALDTPRIDVILLEELRGRSSTDAGGIGEPATVPTAAAVANAIYNATGARVRELPITPARVLKALAERAPGKDKEGR